MVNLTKNVNFINIFCSYGFLFGIFRQKEIWEKSAHKKLMKLTQGTWLPRPQLRLLRQLLRRPLLQHHLAEGELEHLLLQKGRIQRGSRYQFHQHFMRGFSYKSLFCAKILHEKSARKILMKLTAGVNLSQYCVWKCLVCNSPNQGKIVDFVACNERFIVVRSQKCIFYSFFKS